MGKWQWGNIWGQVNISEPCPWVGYITNILLYQKKIQRQTMPIFCHCVAAEGSILTILSKDERQQCQTVGLSDSVRLSDSQTVRLSKDGRLQCQTLEQWHWEKKLDRYLKAVWHWMPLENTTSIETCVIIYKILNENIFTGCPLFCHWWLKAVLPGDTFEKKHDRSINLATLCLKLSISWVYLEAIFAS